jgi:hypothetical protein
VNKEIKDECDYMLKFQLGVSDIDAWWNSPNRAFDGDTPAMALEYDSPTVLEYLNQSSHGTYL